MDHRFFEQGDEQEIVELLVQVFDGWPKFDLSCAPVDHWTWKYLDNPYGSIVALGCDSNNIVHAQHVLIKKVIVGDHEYKNGIGVDVALLKEYRGQGEYGKLFSIKKKREHSLGLKFKNSIDNHPKLIAQSRARGDPVFPHTVNEYVKIWDIDEHFNRKKQTINKLAFKSLASINRAKNVFTNYNTETRIDVSIQQIKKFDDRVDTFWSRIKPSFRFIYVRDKDYLNWRYCDPRGGDFDVFTAELDGVILGIMVLRVNVYDKEYPIGYIVDLLIDPNHREVQGSLLDFMINYFENRNVNYVKYWGVENTVSQHLSRFGFVKKPEMLHVTFNKNDLDMKDYSVLSSSAVDQTHFVLSDHDHI